MKTLLRWAGAIALAVLPAMALAQSNPHTSDGTSVPITSACVTQSNGTCLPISTSVSLPVDTVIRATATDRGAVVATANTAQQLMAANSARRGIAIQNQSSGDCYISGVGTATADYHSLKIVAGGYYESPSTHVGTGAISVICTVANASIYAREW